MTIFKQLFNRLAPQESRPKKRTPSNQKQISDPYDLNRSLIQFSPADHWSIRDACEGVQIFGGIGSGKTSGSGATVARQFLSAGFGGLVLCAKPEERFLWERHAALTGRSKDLIIFSPEHHWRFNFIDYEVRRAGAGAGQTENIVALLTRVIEFGEGGSAGGSRDPFWERAMKELLRNTVDLLSLSGEQITLDNILKIIRDAPTYPDQAVDKEWMARSYCAQSIIAARHTEKSAREEHDLEMVMRYFLKAYAGLAERTRSSIVATFTSVADILLHGYTWELFCTETNIVPEISYKSGAIIIVDLPIQEFNEVGILAQSIFKFMFQRAILRRNPESDPRPVFLWADEAQNFISSYDFQFQAVARSARACTVYMTQNINNYYSVLGPNAHSEAKAFLANLRTKIFHSNDDPDTNQMASEIISKEKRFSTNFGTSSSMNGVDNQSMSRSESVDYKVLPADFTILRKGGPQNNLEVEAIVFQGGRIWQASGDTYLKTIFLQQ